mgnify:FL=1
MQCNSRPGHIDIYIGLPHAVRGLIFVLIQAALDFAENHVLDKKLLYYRVLHVKG